MSVLSFWRNIKTEALFTSMAESPHICIRTNINAWKNLNMNVTRYVSIHKHARLNSSAQLMLWSHCPILLYIQATLTDNACYQ